MSNRIKNLRQDNDLNQEQLGKYLMTSRSNYRDIENNKITLSGDIIEKLILFYHTSFGYLLGLTNKKDKVDDKIYLNIQLKYNIDPLYLSKLKTKKERCLPKDKHHKSPKDD